MSIMPDNYRKRLLDPIIDRRLQTFGALEIAGTKFSGKTWSSMAHSESITHIDDPAIKAAVEIDPTLALSGETPHVIDEWQDIPALWDAIRRAVDKSGNAKGSYILTGSSTVDKSLVSHSGAGRIATIHMRPMSLFETGYSDGSISLKGLFEGRFQTQHTSTSLEDLARFICKGGWPASLDTPIEYAADLPAQYLDALCEVSAVKSGLDARGTRRVAYSLARNIGKTLTYRTLYQDVYQSTDEKLSASAFQKALDPYIDFFLDQYFIENQNGWDAPVKAKSRVRLKPKRSFTDPSLPASLLSMTPERLLYEMQVFGNLFEELCLRDLRVYASALGQIPEPLVGYYADSDGLEVDAIIELSDGRWGAFEIKLSDVKVPQAEKSLIRLKEKIAANPAAQNKEPAFLAILVGKAEFARQLPSGVYVIPITSLGA